VASEGKASEQGSIEHLINKLCRVGDKVDEYVDKGRLDGKMKLSTCG
jgi:hypothetical protein